MKPNQPQTMRDMLNLYLVAGTQDCRHLGGTPQQNLLSVLEQALRSGITCYQLREKGAGSLQDKALIQQLAAECRTLCRQYGVPFVLNNDVEAAIEWGADGVHIGQKDMPLAQAADLCRGRLFIGISNNSFDNILNSRQINRADYFACGPLFPTQSKPDAAAPVGIDLVRRVRAAGITQPLVAIGGIKAAHAAEIRAAGADGIAVISAITQAEDVAAAVRALLAK
ncbi:thiamine phosphate synthase [Neisseria lisongii]|uniref:Thiamine-phosphate synthase n=1 Tax=Neisseria lisongii TaxID=2912188 RepID=A0AAW5ALH8_9NEIS|nr:thiamine phosphate synthase [Neisseria lisongii]MCF7529340.1 thiamine phosphate synthase [Neisseria lisongii]